MNCIVFLFSLIILLSADSASAQSSLCSPKSPGDVSSKLATASALANLGDRPGSLKYELNESITSGLAKLSPSDSAYLALSVIPNKFQDSYSDIESCKQLLTQTTASPLRYDNIAFSSKDKLIDWFYNFTQGKGKAGEDLYSRCPGSCSPQYFTKILSLADSLTLDIAVVCGHARDKWENNYQLKSYLSSSC